MSPTTVSPCWVSPSRHEDDELPQNDSVWAKCGINRLEGTLVLNKLDKGKEITKFDDRVSVHESGSDGTATPAHDVNLRGQEVDRGQSTNVDTDADTPTGVTTGDHGAEQTAGHDSEKEEDTNEEKDVDWTKYDPPDALSTLPRETSEILQRVVEQSLQNIRDQIVEVERVRKEQQEAEEERKTAEEAKQAEDEAAAGTVPPPTPETDIIPEIVIQPQITVVPEPQKKLKPFARLFRHVQNYERGESSAAAARRYMSRSVGNELATRPPPTSAPRSSGLLRKLKTKEKLVAVEVIGETVECTSCFDDIPVSLAIKTQCHSYCPDCFERLVMTALENQAQWPPKCCLNEVPGKLITKHVSKDLAKMYTTKTNEFKVPVGDRLYCPHVDCGVFVPKTHITLGSRTARCSRGHTTCTICRQASHGRGSCPQDYELQRTEQLAEEEGWRRCIQCGVMIEHQDACQHMTCRCGGSFCYVCGAPWRTCACGMDELLAVKERAARRREERTAEEIAEERELREALRAIEEFEREEARKAELLRLEQERIEEERRAKEMEEKMKREEMRRAEVKERFEAERKALNALSEMQEGLVRFQHERETNDLCKKTGNDSAQLAAENKRELAATRAATASQIEQRAKEWEQDFGARVLAERQLEDAYRTKLDGLWLSRADRDERIRVAMEAYMRRNDGRMDEYNRWREREVESHRFRKEEQQAIREELMEHAVRQLRKSLDAEEKARERRQQAELRWVEAVLTERARLLREMEDTEREIGGEVPLADFESFYSLPSEGGEDEVPCQGEGTRQVGAPKAVWLTMDDETWPLRNASADADSVDVLVDVLRPPGSYVH